MHHLRSISLMLTVALASTSALSQEKISGGVVKIGVMNDLTGTYSDLAGTKSVDAAKMAVEDFGGKVLGKPIQVVAADHQNKADVASARAREWFERDNVDVIVDLVNSSTALAVSKIARDANKLVLVSGGGTTRLTNEDCNPNTIHWTYDTYSLANGTARAMVKQGLDSWYFITADYAFGQSLEKDATAVIKEGGGKVLGSVRHPLGSTDLSSYLLQAQASGAKVIGMANAGPDMNNTVKQATEFGVVPKQSLAALLIFVDEVHAMGLKVTQGMYLTTGFYWDTNAETRAWSKRFFERNKRMPNMVHAGVYSSMMHYLKAIQAAGTDDTAAVTAKMRELPVNDFFAKNGRVRADGRMLHDMYLMQVKKPAESRYPWDYYTVRQVIPADQAFLRADKSVCPLLKK
ncbi:MAG: ABC transporter permease [Variovorax paradoxus]|nr:MAG: ABC transporter permease [Variovorax paradoxus]PZQ04174.1 MAG: ABC transporter permease [Variovorax paradoxus]